MKKTILALTFISLSSYAGVDKNKTMEINATISKFALEKPNQYRLEMLEHAAAYTAEEKLIPCLKKSMENKKAVKLKVTAYTQKVLECKEQISFCSSVLIYECNQYEKNLNLQCPFFLLLADQEGYLPKDQQQASGHMFPCGRCVFPIEQQR